MSILGTILGKRRGLGLGQVDVAIDVGHRSVKVVHHGRDRSSARLVPWNGPERLEDGLVPGGTNGDGPSLAEVISRAVVPLGLPRGTKAGCVLSWGYGTFRSFELPPGNDDETLEMVRQEVAGDDDAGAGFEVSYWSTPTPADLRSIGAWRLDHATAAFVSQAFAAAGLECILVDAPAFAMARAACCRLEGGAVAVVDCAAESPSLTIVHRGQPCYARALRDCGQNRTIKALETGLGLPTDDAWRFHANFTGRPEVEAAECRQLLVEYGTATTEALVDEIERTIEHLSRKLPALAPCAVLLLGGGAVPCLDPLRQAFGERVEVLGSEFESMNARVSSPTFAAAGSLLGLEVAP